MTEEHSIQQTGDRGSGKLESFQDLLVWQKAHALVLIVYEATRCFPSEEKFGLASQMRRAAVSVPANIVEGFKKRHTKDKLNFYNIAQGSLEELRYYIILSKDLGYMKPSALVAGHLDEVSRMLHGLAAAFQP